MATTIGQFDGSDGKTYLVEVFASSGDTALSSDTASEKTNNLGTYTFEIPEALAGVYQVRVSEGGVSKLKYWITLVDDTGTYLCYDRVDLVDTNELQADWTDGGRLDLLLDAIPADTNTAIEGGTVGIEVGSVKSTVETNAAATIIASGSTDIGTTTSIEIVIADIDTDKYLGCLALIRKAGHEIDGQARYVTGRIGGSTLTVSEPFTANVPAGSTCYLTRNHLDVARQVALETNVTDVKTDTGNLVTRITSTLFSGITSMLQLIGLIAGKQVGDSTARTELQSTGAGSGTFDEAADSMEAQAERAALIKAQTDISLVTGTEYVHTQNSANAEAKTANVTITEA